MLIGRFDINKREEGKNWSMGRVQIGLMENIAWKI
jgi:hypothetical protein